MYLLAMIMFLNGEARIFIKKILVLGIIYCILLALKENAAAAEAASWNPELLERRLNGEVATGSAALDFYLRNPTSTVEIDYILEHGHLSLEGRNPIDDLLETSQKLLSDLKTAAESSALNVQHIQTANVNRTKCLENTIEDDEGDVISIETETTKDNPRVETSDELLAAAAVGNQEVPLDSQEPTDISDPISLETGHIPILTSQSSSPSSITRTGRHERIAPIPVVPDTVISPEINVPMAATPSPTSYNTLFSIYSKFLNVHPITQPFYNIFISLICSESHLKFPFVNNPIPILSICMELSPKSSVPKLVIHGHDHDEVFVAT